MIERASYKNTANPAGVVNAKSRAGKGTYAFDSFEKDEFVKSAARPEKELTVMFYMNGEYDDIGRTIQQAALNIKRSGSDENVNLLAQLGFTPKTDGKDKPSNYDVRRYYITPDRDIKEDKEYLKDRLNPDKIAEIDSNKSIADPKVLEDFIAYGIKKYPARNYMLVTMGHGGAWKGALDMHPSQMNDAILNGVEKANGETGRNDRIDLHVSNSCLMGSTEALSQMQDSSRFTIASEDVAQGGIFSFWNGILDGIKEDVGDGNSFNPRQFAFDFVEIFRSFQEEGKDASLSDAFKKMLNDGKDADSALDGLSKKFSYRTLSSYDNEKFGVLDGAFAGFVKTMKQERISPFRLFRTIKKVPSFKSFGDKLAGNYHYSAHLRDLGHIMKSVNEAHWSNPRIKDAANGVLNAIQTVTVNEQHGGKQGDYHGLTLYAPTNAGAITDDAQRYVERVGSFEKKTGWHGYLSEAAKATPEWARNEAGEMDLETLTKLGFEAAKYEMYAGDSFMKEFVNQNNEELTDARHRALETYTSEPVDEDDPYKFYQESVNHWPSFMRSLKSNRSPVEERVWTHLDGNSRKAIKEWDGKSPVSEKARKTIVKGLNKLLESNDFADSDIFLNDPKLMAQLYEGKKPLLKIGAKNLEPENLREINRSLIQDIFPSGMTPPMEDDPQRVYADEIPNGYKLFKSLHSDRTPTQEHLYNSFDEYTRGVIEKCREDGRIDDHALRTVVTGMTRLLSNREFPNAEVFMSDESARKQMDGRTRKMLLKGPDKLSEGELRWLNRSLLSCIFPSGLKYGNWLLASSKKIVVEWNKKFEVAEKEGPVKRKEFDRKMKRLKELEPHLDLTRRPRKK